MKIRLMMRDPYPINLLLNTRSLLSHSSKASIQTEREHRPTVPLNTITRRAMSHLRQTIQPTHSTINRDKVYRMPLSHIPYLTTSTIRTKYHRRELNQNENETKTEPKTQDFPQNSKAHYFRNHHRHTLLTFITNSSLNTKPHGHHGLHDQRNLNPPSLAKPFRPMLQTNDLRSHRTQLLSNRLSSSTITLRHYF